MANRPSDFVTEYRQQATAAIKSLQSLQALHREAAIMQYPDDLGDDAFQGENASVDVAKMQAAMTSTEGLLTLLTPEFLRAFYTIRL